MSGPDELAAIRGAVAGLMYPSESDAAIEVMRFPGETARTARELVPNPARAIEEVRIDSFFAGLAKTSDAGRFATLRWVLERELTHLQIFRAAAEESVFDVYVMGRLRGEGPGGGLFKSAGQGEWIVLHTSSVET